MAEKTAYAHPATKDDIPWSEESLAASKRERRSKPTLCIGDVHGHLNRLEALLLQEGIIGDSPDSGLIRINHDVEVVQLGDLGHYGKQTKGKDKLTWSHAPAWLDKILWGNHDRAVLQKQHVFGGYSCPPKDTEDSMKAAIDSGKLVLAHYAHGFVITHAGVHAHLRMAKLPEGYKEKEAGQDFVDWLNKCDLWSTGRSTEAEPPYMEAFHEIRDPISSSRGGRNNYGGILWRDASESLHKDFCQVFGHSSKPKVRKYETKTGISYCVDIGNPDNGKLAGIWLPDERVVEVEVEEDRPALEDDQYLKQLLESRHPVQF